MSRATGGPSGSRARAADPIALTVNFCGAIADGEFGIEAKLQRGGKTTQH